MRPLAARLSHRWPRLPCRVGPYVAGPPVRVPRRAPLRLPRQFPPAAGPTRLPVPAVLLLPLRPMCRPAAGRPPHRPSGPAAGWADPAPGRPALGAAAVLPAPPRRPRRVPTVLRPRGAVHEGGLPPPSRRRPARALGRPRPASGRPERRAARHPGCPAVPGCFAHAAPDRHPSVPRATPACPPSRRPGRLLPSPVLRPRPARSTRCARVGRLPSASAAVSSTPPRGSAAAWRARARPSRPPASGGEATQPGAGCGTARWRRWRDRHSRLGPRGCSSASSTALPQGISRPTGF